MHMSKNSKETLEKRNNKRKQFKHLKSQVEKHVHQECKTCKLVKPCKFNSGFDIHGKPEYRNYCDECYKKRENEYRKVNRKRFNLQSQKRKRALKEKYIAYMGGKCYECGYKKSSRALTFHHKDRREKEFSISQIIDHGWEKVKTELDKCVLICFNCHMELEEKIEDQKIREMEEK